jgi:uncharacterized membrane protein
MEFLGFLALLLVLYLLIAPAVAWVIASSARARAAAAEELAESQSEELSRLSEELAELRKQHLGLQARVKAAGTAATAAVAEAEPETAPPAPPPIPDREPAQSTRATSTPLRTAAGPSRIDLDPLADLAPTSMPKADAADVAEASSAAASASGEAGEIGDPIADQPPAATPAPSETVPPLAASTQAPAETAAIPTTAAMADSARAAAMADDAAASATEGASAPEQGPRASAPERPAAQAPSQPPSPSRSPPRTPPPRVPEPPSNIDTPVSRWLRTAKEWLFGGNLVAKVGLMILFIGAAFLLRLASSHVTVPIELRLAGIAAGAIALLGWGWRIRRTRPGIALPTQGAALAALMLVSFGAFKVWGLLPAGPTFALLLVLVAFTCLLAVLQNALWLAMFGITGGFAVPILTSSGGGSHVALFSYYALLNAGILAIAWQRSWRVLNLLGFLFTFVIGTAWGVQRYEPAHYASAQFFLILFVLFYVAIAVLYAWRQSTRLKLYVDASLVFGVPTVAMALQYGLVRDMHLGSALSALGFGLLYATLASALWRWRQGHLKLLVECFLALAVVFGTLAIPLAFDGRWTSAAWALQGAGMIWIGLKQRQPLVWRFGLLVQLLSWAAFIRALTGLDPVRALTDHISLGFFLLGATGVFLALLFRGQSGQAEDDEDAARARFGGFAAAFISIAAVWLLAGLWMEVWLRAEGVQRASLLVLTAIGLVFGLQWLGKRAAWRVPNLLAGAVSAVAGLSFVSLMARFMDWRNLSAYAETGFGEMLGNSALMGGALLSGAALVTAFSFKRQLKSLEVEHEDSSAALRSTVLWSLLALFWWCGFALHGAAHALAWLTTPAAGEPDLWYRIPFWAGYSVGLALSAFGAMALAQRFAFPYRELMQRLIWPALTAAALIAFLIQIRPRLAIEHLFDFSWAITWLPAEFALGDALRIWLGGPLLGALVFIGLCWVAVQRLRDERSDPELEETQRSRAMTLWLSGLGILVYGVLVDGLALVGTLALTALGAGSENQATWLSYADLRLLWTCAAALLALQLMLRTGPRALRWLALPAAVMQALASLAVLAELYLQARLPSLGTGLALLLTWIAIALCARLWQRDQQLSERSLKWLHFGRVIAPWLMLAPVVSLNLMPWLAGTSTAETSLADSGWVVAGMWPDYLAAWLALAALFLGLRQVRNDGWPLRPLGSWYGRLVIPMAAIWATLLALYWNLRQDGSMQPLPYLPIFNPLDLTTGFVALLWLDLWRMHRDEISEEGRRNLGRLALALAFGWLNLMLLRTAAQYLGLPYRFEPLYHSQFIQAMLSLVWTLCAFGLMRFAVSRLSKPLWMLGAVLLGVVVLKLFVIDLRNVGSVARIVSFMGVGGLMLLIGFLAPLPRAVAEEDADKADAADKATGAANA